MPMALSLLSVTPPFQNRDGLINVRLTYSGTYTGDPINLRALNIAGLTPTEFSKLVIPRVAGAADGKDFRIQNTLTVSGVTNDNPAVITTTEPHGLETGDVPVVASVGGATGVNGTRAVTVLTANTFSVAVAAGGAYTSGGTVTPVPALKWAGVGRLYAAGTSTEASSTVATTVDLPIIWRKSVV